MYYSSQKTQIDRDLPSRAVRRVAYAQRPTTGDGILSDMALFGGKMFLQPQPSVRAIRTVLASNADCKCVSNFFLIQPLYHHFLAILNTEETTIYLR